MYTLEITKEEIAIAINDQLTGELESATCSGAQSFNFDANYVFLESWECPDGKTRDVIIPGIAYLQGYNNHGTSKLPDWFKEVDKKNPTFLIRLFKKLKGIN